MSDYTIKLCEVCNLYGKDEVKSWFTNYNIEHFLTPIQIELIEKYKVWDKERLAEKIVDHYFMREIGFETPALFKHYAKVYMNEIMERKLPLIYTNFLEFDPLSNVDYTETYTREIEGNSNATGKSNSNSSSKSDSLSISNNTPQKRINRQDLESGVFASNVSQNENNSNIEDETKTESSGNSKTIETYTHHMEGDNGVIITNQRLVKEFRENIVAIDEEIIEELNKLFMGLF